MMFEQDFETNRLRESRYGAQEIINRALGFVEHYECSYACSVSALIKPPATSDQQLALKGRVPCRYVRDLQHAGSINRRAWWGFRSHMPVTVRGIHPLSKGAFPSSPLPRVGHS